MPVHVLVDLSRLQPGGTNGGIARFMHSLLPAVASAAAGAIEFTLLLGKQLRAAPEAAALARVGRLIVEDELTSPPHSPEPEFDVVYAAFGDSKHFDRGRRCVSLVVDTLHRDLPLALPAEEVAIREAAFQRFVARADVFQCNSRFVVDQLGRHFGVPRSRTLVIANAIHSRHPVRFSIFRRRRRTWFYPANSWPHKNHETLIAAYELYRARAGRVAWNLLLTGHPDDRFAKLEALIECRGLDDAVTFAGFITEADYPSIWQRVGALVFPSLYEGFGIPLLEAMHQGLPIVASSAASIPEVVDGAALLVDAREPHELANAMLRLAREPHLRRQLRRAGKRRVEDFKLEREAGKLRDILLELASR